MKSKYLKFKNLLAPLSLGVLIASAAHSTAASIPVQNHSFEFNNTGNTATDQLGVVPPGPGGQESGNPTPAGWTVSGASMDNRWYGTSRFRMAGPTHGVGPGAPGWTGPADVVPSATVLFLRIGNANNAATVGTAFASQNLGTVDDVFGADPAVRLSYDARFGVAWAGDGNEAGEQIDQSFTATITVNGVPYATYTSHLGTLAQGRTLLKWGELPGSPAYLATLPNSNPFNQVFPVDFSQVLSTNMMNLTLDLDKTTIPGGLGGGQLGIRFELTDTGGTAGTAPNATVTIDNVRMDSFIPSYTVIYNGNVSTGGTPPTDASSPYLPGATVTVLGNTGSLVKTGFTFSGWNTAANGSGTDYAPASTFTINSNVTLYAKWTDTYATWISGFSGVGGFTDRIDDPDQDEGPNFLEFALNSNPANGASFGKAIAKLATVGGDTNVLTFTIAVRSTAGAFVAVGNNQQSTDIPGDHVYLVEASNNLSDWGTPVVTEVTGADATAIQAGLPALDSGWSYKTFRTDGHAGNDASDFIRVKVTSPIP